METKRTITVTSNKLSQNLVFDTEATTIGQIREELIERGVDLNNQDMYEGISKHTFTNDPDDAVLPTDLPWKGSTTNNLVFMLTTVNKKIDSGATRTELLEEAKNILSNNSSLKSVYGNITQRKSIDLEQLNAKYGASTSTTSETLKTESTSEVTKDDVNTSREVVTDNSQEIASIKKAILTLVDYLVDDDLCYYKGEAIKEILASKVEVKSSVESPFSASDIANMRRR